MDPRASGNKKKKKKKHTSYVLVSFSLFYGKIVLTFFLRGQILSIFIFSLFVQNGIFIARSHFQKFSADRSSSTSLYQSVHFEHNSTQKHRIPL